MNLKKDYYAILGAQPSWTMAQLRASWRRLIADHHPDRWAAHGAEREREATRLSQEVNEAWQILSDERQRLEYDRKRTLHLMGIVSWRAPSFGAAAPFAEPRGRAAVAQRPAVGVSPEELAALMNLDRSAEAPLSAAPPAPDDAPPPVVPPVAIAPPAKAAAVAIDLASTPWGGRAILYVVGMVALLTVLVAVVVGGALALLFYAPDSRVSDDEYLLLALMTQAFIDAAIVGAVYRFALRPRGLGLSALGLHGLKPRHLGYVAAGVAISWVAIIAYGTLVELIGLDGLLPQSTVPADEQFFDTPAPILVGAVLILGFAPISEELFFRGFVFPGLVPRWGWVMAGLGSGLMFASIHFDIGSIVPFTIIGFVLAWLYHRTGTVWAPIAMHFVFNAISFAAIVASDLS